MNVEDKIIAAALMMALKELLSVTNEQKENNLNWLIPVAKIDINNQPYQLQISLIVDPKIWVDSIKRYEAEKVIYHTEGPPSSGPVCDYSSSMCVAKKGKEGALIATPSGWVCPCGEFRKKFTSPF